MSKTSDWKIWIDKKLEKQESLAWGSIQKSFKKDFPNELNSKDLKTFVLDNYTIIPDPKFEKARIMKKSGETQPESAKIETLEQQLSEVSIELLDSPDRYKCIFSKDFLNVIDTATNRVINVAQGHPHFFFLQELFKEKNYKIMFEVSDPGIFITENLKDFVYLKGNSFYIRKDEQEYEIPKFQDIIRDLCLDIESYKNLEFFKKFIIKLLNNESISELPYFLLYLSTQKFIINESGNIIAYKAVRQDYYDKHSGTIRNSVGATISMPRSRVTQDRNVTCSTGLHVGNLDYINNYWDSRSDHLLAVEIEPEHLVSVPGTTEGKIRVCQYRVLCQIRFETALRKNKFISTKDFIETFSINRSLLPSFVSTDFGSWIDKKLEKQDSITWGGLRKSFNKTFPQLQLSELKKFVEQHYLVIHEKKSENSKIRKK